MRCEIYKDKQLIFSGSTSAARKIIHSTKYNIEAHIDTEKELKGFIIRTPSDAQTRDAHYRRVVMMLGRYGNTVLVTDHEYIIGRLRREGWKISEKKYKDEDGVHYIIKGEYASGSN